MKLFKAANGSNCIIPLPPTIATPPKPTRPKTFAESVGFTEQINAARSEYQRFHGALPDMYGVWKLFEAMADRIEALEK
jgi:hypothetical protein